jgi:hypothetical protein
MGIRRGKPMTEQEKINQKDKWIQIWLTELINETPNDTELGKLIRKKYGK